MLVQKDDVLSWVWAIIKVLLYMTIINVCVFQRIVGKYWSAVCNEADRTKSLLLNVESRKDNIQSYNIHHLGWTMWQLYRQNSKISSRAFHEVIGGDIKLLFETPWGRLKSATRCKIYDPFIESILAAMNTTELVVENIRPVRNLKLWPVQRSTNWASKLIGSWSLCWIQINLRSGE